MRTIIANMYLEKLPMFGQRNKNKPLEGTSYRRLLLCNHSAMYMAEWLCINLSFYFIFSPKSYNFMDPAEYGLKNDKTAKKGGSLNIK
jgi:hypothetical protein